MNLEFANGLPWAQDYCRDVLVKSTYDWSTCPVTVIVDWQDNPQPDNPMGGHTLYAYTDDEGSVSRVHLRTDVNGVGDIPLLRDVFHHELGHVVLGQIFTPEIEQEIVTMFGGDSLSQFAGGIWAKQIKEAHCETFKDVFLGNWRKWSNRTGWHLPFGSFNDWLALLPGSTFGGGVRTEDVYTNPQIIDSMFLGYHQRQWNRNLFQPPGTFALSATYPNTGDTPTVIADFVSGFYIEPWSGLFLMEAPPGAVIPDFGQAISGGSGPVLRYAVVAPAGSPSLTSGYHNAWLGDLESSGFRPLDKDSSLATSGNPDGRYWDMAKSPGFDTGLFGPYTITPGYDASAVFTFGGNNGVPDVPGTPDITAFLRGIGTAPPWPYAASNFTVGSPPPGRTYASNHITGSDAVDMEIIATR